MTAFNNQAKDLNATKDVTINLARGWPNPALLPTSLLRQAAAATLSDTETVIAALLYGPDAGAPQLRKNIARWLTDYYEPQEAISMGRITITGGASQSLGCVLQVYTDPAYTQNVWCVVPCYMSAFRIMEDAGFANKLRSVPEDEGGIDVAFLGAELQKIEGRVTLDCQRKPLFKPERGHGKYYRHVIYTVPTFSNPSSSVMSLRRRQQLVRLAREFDALVVCDDVYDFLQWATSTTSATSGIDKALLPRVVDIDRFLDGGAQRPGSDGFGNVTSNGSFSKIAAPGLRTGWVEGSEKFAYGVSQAGTTHSGGAPSQITASFISSLLESRELQLFILEVLQPSYARRYRSMLTATQKHLCPLGVELDRRDGPSTGGYFIWLALPEDLMGRDVAARAITEENVLVVHGAMFEVAGDNTRGRTNFEHNLRMCFAWEDEHKLVSGVEGLANVVKRMLAEKQTGSKHEQAHPVG